MFVAQNLPQDVLLAGAIMGTPATFFSKDTRSWNSSSVGFILFFFYFSFNYSSIILLF